VSQFTVQLELSDLVSANRLHILRHWTGLRAVKLFFWLLIFYSVVVSVITWSSLSDEPRKLVAVPILALGMTLAHMALCVILGIMLLPSTSKKLWAQSAEVRKAANWSLGDGVLTITNVAGDYAVQLDEVHKWTESSSLFLLYVNDQLFRLLTKRSMTLEQQNRLRTELQSAQCPRSSFAIN
jgi:YcxB-like protein